MVDARICMCPPFDYSSAQLFDTRAKLPRSEPGEGSGEGRALCTIKDSDSSFFVELDVNAS